jgi:hypothetical protein
MDAQAMIAHLFAEHRPIWSMLGLGAWFAVGTSIGTFHFIALQWNVRLFAVRHSLPLAFSLQLLRFGAIAGMLALIANYFGALPLLAGTVGIQVGRAAVIRFGVQP